MHETKLFLLCSLLFSAQYTNAFHQRNAEALSNNPIEASEVAFKQQQYEINNNIVREQSNNVDNNISMGNINSNNNELTERNKLLFYTLEQFALLSDFTIKQGTTVLRKVVKEASTLEEPTVALQAHLKSFNDYIVISDNLAKQSEHIEFNESYDIVVKFTEMVEEHTTKTKHENATTENMFLEMLLKKNGLDKLQVDFLDRFLNFIKNFNKCIDNYLEKLTMPQRAEEQKMIDWYRMFNDETDPEKKVDIFIRFFDLY
ncbi:uncharacterized protein [Eurosta solidaginis]|uniref:uncharacterized protein isoform X1 n=1 Tax=Eurosta solidaginis TaxID=178769 RepID=UPI00353056D3